MRSQSTPVSPLSRPRVCSNAATGFLASCLALASAASSALPSPRSRRQGRAPWHLRRRAYRPGRKSGKPRHSRVSAAPGSGCRIRHQAEIDKRHPERALARGDHHVAMEQDGAADADGIAIDAGKDRFGKRRQRAEHVGDGGDQLLMLGGVEEFGEVATEAEAAGEAAQHHDAYIVVDGRFVEGPGQACIGPPVQHRPAVIRRHSDDQRMIAQFGLRMDGSLAVSDLTTPASCRACRDIPWPAPARNDCGANARHQACAR